MVYELLLTQLSCRWVTVREDTEGWTFLGGNWKQCQTSAVNDEFSNLLQAF